MATWTYTFKHMSALTPGATFATLSNVTSASIERNRDNVVDPIPKSRGRITGTKPNLMPAIAIGDAIRVQASTLSWDFIVSDYRVSYGFTTTGDYWTIELEDAAAGMGRATYSPSWVAGRSATYAWGSAVEQSGALVDYPTFTFTNDPMSAQTLTNANAASVARIALNTMQQTQGFATWIEPVSPAALPDYNMLFPTKFRSVAGPVFNDGTVTAVTAAHWRYDDLVYSSLANQYWDQIIAEPSGLAAQTYGTGRRAYSFPTYNQTTAAALEAATNTYAMLSNKTSHPIQITAQLKRQGASVVPVQLDDMLTVYFRGGTAYAAVIGVAYDFQPTDTRMVVTLSGYESLNFLILDDAILGRLDYNKLGI